MRRCPAPVMGTGMGWCARGKPFVPHKIRWEHEAASTSMAAHTLRRDPLSAKSQSESPTDPILPMFSSLPGLLDNMKFTGTQKAMILFGNWDGSNEGAGLRPGGPCYCVTWLAELQVDEDSCGWASDCRSRHEGGNWNSGLSNFDQAGLVPANTSALKS